MKVESADFLTKARDFLDAARTIRKLGLPGPAATQAYLAAYHAAYAMVFEATGKVVKTHSGMRTILAKVVKDDGRIDPALSSLLARAYKFKELADYGVGSQAVVKAEEADG